MLEMSGEERFDQDPDRVYAALTDLKLLAKNIPDLVSHEIVGENELRCVVRPGFSFLRMTMKTRIVLVPEPAARTALMRVSSQGIGAAMDVESRVSVTPADSGALLQWSAQVVKTTGLVSTVSRDLVRAAAEQVIRSGWQQIRAQLAATG
jgi:carbon monoxide dehydrogenase subunit G